ncbi:hypothetical protein EI94DRAFT_1708047 [Lactarius quietus]|nr:hypothetical protein EI94DRAFT_1708047 [Lactarius quietus]
MFLVLHSDPTLGQRQRRCLHEHWKNCHDYPEAHTWESRAEEDIEEEEAVRALVQAEDDSYLSEEEACRIRQLESFNRTDEDHVTRPCDEVPDHGAGLKYKSRDLDGRTDGRTDGGRRKNSPGSQYVSDLTHNSGDFDAKVASGIGRRQLCPEDDQRQQTAIVWCKTSGLMLDGTSGPWLDVGTYSSGLGLIPFWEVFKMD